MESTHIFIINNNHILIIFTYIKIVTNIEWKDANIRGSYYYSNTTYFEQGNYRIILGGIRYQANTPLSENTMKYPSSVPKSSISYESVKALFSRNIPAVTNVDNLYNLK